MDRVDIAVLGAGSWGTALAVHLARNGCNTCLWGRDTKAMQAMQVNRCNTSYFPEFTLPETLRLTTDLETTVTHSNHVLIAVPSHSFAQFVQRIQPWAAATTGIAWATKGFEPGTGRFLHAVVRDHFPHNPMAIVTGPSFAREVMQGLPTALTIHASDDAFAQQLATALHACNLRAYTGHDMLGAELGGAVKNVLAVATGIADGMQLGLNARAGLITRGMYEILQLGVALGARAETLIGLAGMGDLVLTCTGDLSRNRRLGLALGQGVPLAEAVAQIGQAIESLKTAEEAARLAEQHQLDLPITFGVRAVLRGELTPAAAFEKHMARDQKPEYISALFS